MEKAYGPKVQALSHCFLYSTLTNNFKGARAAPQIPNAPPLDDHSQNYFSRSHNTNRPLPPPNELSSRIEEARTSAKLLTQLVQSTPPDEFFQNDLIREFADRCLSASRSVQGYIIAQNPAPDNDTMLTLIETNDQLALAMSKHQRAILQARKTLGSNTENGASPSNNSPDSNTGYVPPPGPPPSFAKPAMPPRKPAPPLVPTQPSTQEAKRVSERSNVTLNPYATESPDNPFKDPATTTMPSAPFPTDQQPPTDQFFDRLGVEPYHPGFNPTQSYMSRQDSAVGKVAMHAGGPSTPEKGSAERGVVEQNHVSEEDNYDVSPIQRKAPIYRY
jgi:GAT domain